MVGTLRTWILLVIGCGMAQSCLVPVVMAKDTASWIAEGRRNFQPRSVAFLTSFGGEGQPEFYSLNEQSLGFIRIMAGEQARLKFMLNDYEPNRPGYNANSGVGKIEALQSILELAAVVVAPVGGRKKWTFIGHSNGELVKLAEQPGPRSAENGVGGWLMDALGYEGLVVDRRGDLLLVVALPGKLTGRSQGVVLRQSASRFIYPRDPAAGAALIELVKADGDFGVFRVLLDGGDGSVVKGAKILLQEGG